MKLSATGVEWGGGGGESFAHEQVAGLSTDTDLNGGKVSPCVWILLISEKKNYSLLCKLDQAFNPPNFPGRLPILGAFLLVSRFLVQFKN